MVEAEFRDEFPEQGAHALLDGERAEGGYVFAPKALVVTPFGESFLEACAGGGLALGVDRRT